MRNLERTLSLLLALGLMIAAVPVAYAAVEDTGFSDVDASAWYVGAVEYCRERGWMAGTSATTFSPEGTLTRAQLVTILCRVEGEPTVTGEDSFTDTEPGRWYSNAVLWASRRGLVNGYGNGLFGTNDPVTQEHLTLIFQRYTDAAVTEGIPGFDGSRSPATRAQTAAVLMAYAQSQGQQPAQGEADNMVLLPGGTFTMGSPDSERLREADEIAHQVTVSSFYIDPYEVTQADYERIMGTNPSHFNGADLPVDSVTWYDAIEYCNKLSESRGLTPVYTVNGQSVSWNRAANGYRLLTEAEWEYATRAGTSTEFYTGHAISDSQANYYGRYPYMVEENYIHHNNQIATGGYRGTTVAANELAPNAFGLYHMLGNVSEWVYDCYGEYDRGQTADPVGAAEGHLRVNRGGGYNDYAKHLRAAYRSPANPASADRNTGFRIARNAQPLTGTAASRDDLGFTMPENPKVLIVYYSRSGNTENAARLLQEKTGADMVEIQMAQPYTTQYEESAEDLYAGRHSELRTRIQNLAGYDVILLGYPNWWATLPMPVVSFLESHDFSGKAVMPFCSHGSGHFGETVALLAKELPDSYIGFGFEFEYSGGSSLSNNLSRWLEQNGIPKIWSERVI